LRFNSIGNGVSDVRFTSGKSSSRRSGSLVIIKVDVVDGFVSGSFMEERIIGNVEFF
jgi:hypothetical protein